MNPNDSFFEIVLDEEVDFVRFHAADYATVHSKDGSTMGIKLKDNGWVILPQVVHRDAATASGMYDD